MKFVINTSVSLYKFKILPQLKREFPNNYLQPNSSTYNYVNILQILQHGWLLTLPSLKV